MGGSDTVIPSNENGTKHSMQIVENSEDLFNQNECENQPPSESDQPQPIIIASPNQQLRFVNRRKSTRRSLLLVPEPVSPLVKFSQSPVITRKRTPLQQNNRRRSVAMTNLPTSALLSDVGMSSSTPIKLKTAADDLIPNPPTIQSHVSSRPVQPTDALITAEQLWESYQNELSQWHKLVDSYITEVDTHTPKLDTFLSSEWIKQDRILCRYRDVLQPLLPTSNRSAPTLPTNQQPVVSSLDSILNAGENILFDLTCLPGLLNRQSMFLKRLRRLITQKWEEQRQLSLPTEPLGSLMTDFLDST